MVEIPGATDDCERYRSGMRRLSQEALDAARDFVMTRARRLDRALFRFDFDDGPAAAVWDELRRYQNDDGGFGMALEPDQRAPESSVLATQTALDIAHHLGDPTHELVADAVAYLVDVFDHHRGVWRFLPETMTPAPHAPWWDQDGLEEAFGGFAINPRAKVMAHLLWAARPEGLALVDRLLAPLLDLTGRLEAPLDVNSLECLHDLAARLDGEEGLALRRRHDELAEASVTIDPEEWAGYGVKPLDVVHDPSDPLYQTLRRHVEAHLDFEIDRQSDDGSWRPTWSWFGGFPESWPIAEVEWAGHLTVETIRTLRRFGRLAA